MGDSNKLHTSYNESVGVFAGASNDAGSSFIRREVPAAAAAAARLNDWFAAVRALQGTSGQIHTYAHIIPHRTASHSIFYSQRVLVIASSEGRR